MTVALIVGAKVRCYFYKLSNLKSIVTIEVMFLGNFGFICSSRERDYYMKHEITAFITIFIPKIVRNPNIYPAHLKVILVILTLTDITCSK